MAEHETKVGVSTLVSNGDRVLLVRRAHTHGDGTWGPPSGHFNFGESIEDCSQRETKEETGVDIDTIKFRAITNDLFTQEQKHYITIWVDAHYVSGTPHVDAPEEESEVGWFTWDALPQPLFLPLQHLLEGQTYPSQTTSDKIGAAADSTMNLHYPTQNP
jgi:8-oxo-dGTP diphosphatase